MTISADQRRDQMREMLIRFVEDVGDHSFHTVLFGPDESDYSSWLPTSWFDLKGKGFLEEARATMGRPPEYRLTAAGWSKGLSLSGKQNSVEVRDRAIILIQFLKKQIEGRRDHHEAFVDVEDVEKATGLPAGWVWNVVASHLLHELFPNDRMNATLDFKHFRMLRVPPTFGQKPVGGL